MCTTNKNINGIMSVLMDRKHQAGGTNITMHDRKEVEEHYQPKYIHMGYQIGMIGITIKMKGTKVLTLGAGREVLPHNMAPGGYKDVDADDILYTRPLAIRMRGTVNWWAGWSI